MVTLTSHRLHDTIRIQTQASGRLLHKLSARSLAARHPALLLALSLIGLLMIATLSLRFVAKAKMAALFGRDANAGFLDEVGRPRPLLVIAGGAPRTGSTFIFNILRVLLRIRDPNTVASSNWMLAKLVPENNTLVSFDRIALLRTLGTTVLVKVHTAKQYYDFAGPAHKNKFADDADLLVTGYRDLRDETVSAYKIFAKNRTEWQVPGKWREMCTALIRRRNSLINEAGYKVPIVDVRYEDWNDGSDEHVLTLIRRLSRSIPWKYSEEDLKSTLAEVQRLRVPDGGPDEHRVAWHLSNLMSPKHISLEEVGQDLTDMGVNAVMKEPLCAGWLSYKHYI